MTKPRIRLTADDRAPASRRRGRPRSKLADQAILNAALKVFIESGMGGASIEQIADYARVARTTLYRRWASKEALIAQAIASARGDDERLTAHQARFTKSPAPLIATLAETVTKSNYRDMVARLIGSIPDCPELMETYWNNYLLPRRTAMLRVIEAARERGIVREDSDPEILLDLISGAIVHHLLIRPGKRTVSDVRSYLFRVVRELTAPEPLNNSGRFPRRSS